MVRNVPVDSCACLAVLPGRAALSINVLPGETTLQSSKKPPLHDWTIKPRLIRLELRRASALQERRAVLISKISLLFFVSNMGNRISNRLPRRSDAEYQRLILVSLDGLSVIDETDSVYDTAFETLLFDITNETIWVKVFIMMMDVIPIANPAGPTLMGQYIAMSSVPISDMAALVEKKLVKAYNSNKTTENTKANVAMAFALLADRFAGNISEALFTDNVFKIITDGLSALDDPTFCLYSLLALEKFSLTANNKVKITTDEVKKKIRRLERAEPGAVGRVQLAKWEQVRFYAAYCLDMQFGRISDPSYKQDDAEGLFCFLDKTTSTVSLKVSPNGLTMRSDSGLFESFKASRRVKTGIWYYEVEILTNGVMQIGWACKSSVLDAENGHGVGNDHLSIAYDGWRRCLWHGGALKIDADVHKHTWSPGDTVGCLVNADRGVFTFTLNSDIMIEFEVDHETRMLMFFMEEGVYPAASYTSFQHAKFNFGSRHFKHPPPIPFNNLNENLLPDELNRAEELRPLLKRKITLIQADTSAQDLSKCTICYAYQSHIVLVPCKHEGFCSNCAKNFDNCPICRAPIREFGDINVEKIEKIHERCAMEASMPTLPKPGDSNDITPEEAPRSPPGEVRPNIFDF